jgi:hypothetical protein
MDMIASIPREYNAAADPALQAAPRGDLMCVKARRRGRVKMRLQKEEHAHA